MSPEPFVAQLEELCRAHPTRAKWVFVPHHAMGLTLGDRLAREGCDWANLRFVTPADVAVRMAAPFLVEHGVDPSPDELGPALVRRLLAGLPGVEGYFRPMADQPTLAGALWRTVRELRYAGVRSADIPASAFTSPAKHAELVALLQAYEQHLETRRIADMPTVLKEACEHLDWCPIDPSDLVIEAPGVAWPPVTRRFLDALRGSRISPRTLEIPGLDVPARVAALAAKPDSVAPAVHSDASRLRFLRASEQAGPARHDGSLQVFHAGGHDAEVEAVVRSVMASPGTLDQVEIVCASDTLVLTAWEKASRLGWPVTVSAGIPAAMTRPGRALLRWCEWVEGGFAASDLRVLLQSNDISIGPSRGAEPGGADASGVSPGTAARLLVKAGCTWGRDTYAPALEAHATDLERKAAEDGETGGWRTRRAAQCRVLGRWAQGLVDAVPAGGDDGKVSVAEVLIAAARFLEAHAVRASDLDHASFTDVTHAIDRLRTLDTSRVPITLALELVEEAVVGLRVARSRPRPGHLHISSLADASSDGRPIVFVCGLAEAQVFAAAVEDPVLLDVERQAIGVAAGASLASSSDRLAESVFGVVCTLARLGSGATRLALSFSCVDTRDYRQTFPSWLILQAWRIREGRPDASYEDLQAGLGEPASPVPLEKEAAPAASSWWLRASRLGEAALPAIAEAYPAVERGRLALVRRAADVFTEFDGLVPAAGPGLDFTATDRVVSATQLQNAATCPFRFFLERGLGIEPVEDEGESDDEWLGALRRGAELHDLYAALLRRARAEKRRVSVRKDADWMVERARARLEELTHEIPPPSDEVCAAESAEILEDVRMFVELEAEDKAVEPVGFEVAFGHPGGSDTEPEPLARDEPVAIPLGQCRRLLLRGRIDRIDRLGKSAYQVLDYKTGRFKRADYEGVFRQGRLLQHALYGAAAEVILAPTDKSASVIRGVYWHPTGRGSNRRAVIRAPGRPALVRVLQRLADVVGSGLFIQSPEEGSCKYCPFAAACGEKPWEAPARKLKADTSGSADAWQALQEVE